MQTLLISGIDTVTGANLAAVLSDRFQIIGVPSSRAVEIEGIRCLAPFAGGVGAAKAVCHESGADWLIHAGAATRSCWTGQPLTARELDGKVWASAAAEFLIPFTYLSSDALFTGPWMFHSERSDSHCRSAEAELLRAAECDVTQHCPQALIVRTHCLGWSPFAEGWVDETYRGLEAGQAISLDCVRHASPLLASDLAEFLLQARDAGLDGTYHIAGAERVSPVDVATRLAGLCEFESPKAVSIASLERRVTGFGQGETSLQTREFRHATGAAMPLLNDSLQRLIDQRSNGHRDRLLQPAARSAARVA